MKPWFKAKEYGGGWYPATWQGWLVMAVWLVAMVAVFRDIDSTSHSGSDTLMAFLIPAILLTTALLVVCWLTGEPFAWRWGKKGVR